MSVESAAPSNARAVYATLIALGVIAALVGAALIGVIAYNYVTRIELREPVEQNGGGHAYLPDWVTIA